MTSLDESVARAHGVPKLCKPAGKSVIIKLHWRVKCGSLSHFVYIELQAGTWTFLMNDVMWIMLGGPSFDIIKNIRVKYER